MMPVLEVKDLSVSLHTPRGLVRLISQIDFSLNPGEKFGIVGESGCGKSLTALSIMSLLPANAIMSGEIWFQGKNIQNLTEKQLRRMRGNRISMIFQEPMSALNPVKTIGAQIAEGLLLHLRINKKEAEIRTKQLLDSVGLPVSRFSLNLFPHQLSGGQRQRVMIAIAIACQPDVLIADEPTTALDVTVQERILDLINEIVEDSRMSLLMISHDLGIIAQTTERMVVMYAGNIVESGTTVDVFQSMVHPYTYGLFSAIPKPNRHLHARERLYSIPGQVPEPDARPVGCNFADRCFQVEEICRITPPDMKIIHGQHKVACYRPISHK